MNDDQAEDVLEAVAALAVAIRDDGPPEIEQAAREALAAAGGDPVAALVVAAALVRVDEPVDRWWQRGLEGIAPVAEELTSTRAPVAVCGTRSGFKAHKRKRETPCAPCATAERTYNTARMRARRAVAA